MTITSDGWSDIYNRPLLNMLACSPRGEMFLHSIDTSGELKTGQYIAEQLENAILQVGSEKVVQVCIYPCHQFPSVPSLSFSYLLHPLSPTSPDPVPSSVLLHVLYCRVMLLWMNWSPCLPCHKALPMSVMQLLNNRLHLCMFERSLFALINIRR